MNEGVEEGSQKSEAIKLFSSPLVKEPLYPVSTYSLKETLLILLQWHSKNEMSLRAFEDNLNILFNLLPKLNRLPGLTANKRFLFFFSIDRFHVFY